MALSVDQFGRPAPHPLLLRVDDRPPAFPQAREQVLIGLGASFEEWPKLLDEIRRSVGQLRDGRQVASVDGPQDLVPTASTSERVLRFRNRTKGWVEGTLRQSPRGRLGN